MKTFLIFLFFDRRQWRTVLFISSKSFHLCPFLINTFRSGTTQLLQILLDSIVSNKEMIEHSFQIFVQLAFFGSKDRMTFGMKPHVFLILIRRKDSGHQRIHIDQIDNLF